MLSLAVVAGSFVLDVRGPDQVVVPLLNTNLPTTCTFRQMVGIPCPGCGLTRSFISFAHGRLATAWDFNPAGVLFLAVVVFQIPYRLFQIVRIRRGLGEHRFARLDNWVLAGLVVVLLMQWIFAIIHSTG